MLLEYLLNGTEVVKDYILSLGYKAVVAMMLLMILLISFPLYHRYPYKCWQSLRMVCGEQPQLLH